MKTAANIFLLLAGLALLVSIMSCGTGRQLQWREAEITGVYAAGIAGIFGLIAGALFGIDWIRKNIKVE